MEKYDLNSLTTHQNEVLTGIGVFLRDHTKKELTLRGSAGTGKTYLTRCMIHSLRNSYKIAVTAPTNKAVKVLQEGFANMPSITFTTTHSVLGLRELIKPDGSISFKQDPDKNKIRGYNLLIVDECSMVNKELYALIQESRVKVIYVGDDKQINPVGESISPTFKIPNTLTLVEILRQKADSEILNFVYDYSKISQRNSCNDFTITSSKAEFVELLEAYNPEKIIGWTNEYVDAMNAWSRIRMYGEEASQEFLVGEKLIMSSPYVESDKVLFGNSEEIIVENLEEYLEDKDSSDLSQWVLTCRGERGQVHDINLVHKASKHKYDTYLNMLAKEAKQMVLKKVNPGLAWKDFYEVKNQFADLKYSYAITAHKSQGSTYGIVAVNIRDIMKNFNRVERDKILYTALTRASDKVIVLV